MNLNFRAIIALLAVLVYPCVGNAQSVVPLEEVSSGPPEPAALSLPAAFDSAPPPEPPASVSRDSEGRTTVRATRLSAPLRVDGNLDEDLYRTITPISDFIQTEPQSGAPATERTEVWISFDNDNIYVSVRASESQPERMVINDMRRDSNNIAQNENFQFSFDTFYDRRNSVNFQFNPIGGRMDGQVTNESSYNGDWNPVWNFQVKRGQGEWTAEAAVPFKSLRYKQGAAQIWGFQSRRLNRWKNEVSYLTQVPPGQGFLAFQRVSSYATLVGVEVPRGSRALDIKPYVTSDVSTDLSATPAFRNDVGKDVGVDLKYAVTQNLTGDFTYNTDFAQVEVDEQQINLTRFNLFFPEKRDFFLENQGFFSFATTLGGNNNNTGDTPTLFYSRRIGLDRGQLVPIEVGGRLSGRVGRYTVGLLNIQTDDVDRVGLPSTNFTVVRLKRDVLRRGAIGAIYTRRSMTADRTGSAESYGVDGSFGFFENLNINTYWARTKTPGVSDEHDSYRLQTTYNGDRYGMNFERLTIGENFDPQIGFVRRRDFRKNRGMLRFSPRPRNRFKAVRKFNYQASFESWHNSAGQLETREWKGEFYAEFQSSDRLQIELDTTYEFLPEPFDIDRTVTIPIGGYDQRTLRAEFQIGQQRKVAGTLFTELARFYDGDRRAVGYSPGRVNVSSRLYVEPALTLNRVSLPFGDFTTKLISGRTTYTLTPMMFVSALVQYNSSNNTLGANIRLRWEYQPGSELFVVYNEGRDTQLRPSPTLQTRAFVVKINRLFRF